MIILRKLFAVFTKRAYGTKFTPTLSMWRRDLQKNTKTADSISNFDPKTSRVIDKDSVGESIRQARLNLNNSIEAGKDYRVKLKGWDLESKDEELLRQAKRTLDKIDNHIYVKQPDYKANNINNGQLKIFPNTNKFLSGQPYNGEKYEYIKDFKKLNDKRLEKISSKSFKRMYLLGKDYKNN